MVLRAASLAFRDQFWWYSRHCIWWLGLILCWAYTIQAPLVSLLLLQNPLLHFKYNYYNLIYMLAIVLTQFQYIPAPHLTTTKCPTSTTYYLALFLVYFDIPPTNLVFSVLQSISQVLLSIDIVYTLILFLYYHTRISKPVLSFSLELFHSA